MYPPSPPSVTNLRWSHEGGGPGHSAEEDTLVLSLRVSRKTGQWGHREVAAPQQVAAQTRDLLAP